MVPKNNANFVYATTRTDMTSVYKLLEMCESDEEIRVRKEMERFQTKPFPLFRIYSKTLPNSNVSTKLNRSKGYEKLKKSEFENSIYHSLVKEIWNKIEKNGNLSKTTLLLMAGPSLPSKSKLCESIVKFSRDSSILVSEDFVRKIVASKNRNSEPSYTAEEDSATMIVSWELIRMGLKSNCNVIFDSNNMTETERLGAYASANDKNTDILVVYLPPDKSSLSYISELKNQKQKKQIKHSVEVKFYKSKSTKDVLILDKDYKINDSLWEISKVTAMNFRY